MARRTKAQIEADKAAEEEAEAKNEAKEAEAAQEADLAKDAAVDEAAAIEASEEEAVRAAAASAADLGQEQPVVPEPGDDNDDDSDEDDDDKDPDEAREDAKSDLVTVTFNGLKDKAVTKQPQFVTLIVPGDEQDEEELVVEGTTVQLGLGKKTAVSPEAASWLTKHPVYDISQDE